MDENKKSAAEELAELQLADYKAQKLAEEQERIRQERAMEEQRARDARDGDSGFVMMILGVVLFFGGAVATTAPEWACIAYPVAILGIMLAIFGGKMMEER